MLDAIVARTRADLRARMAARPLASFAAGLAPSDRSLEAALRRPRTGFILECKRASPSRGVLCADFDPVALGRAYGPFADAISVLTNEPFFGGRHEDLAAVRAAVPLPVLCKDFVVDPYQVYEARRHGADAVLLMLSVLGDEEYRRCAAAAAELGLDVLTEAHTPAELDRALALGARVIGLNSRDLRTLAVDHATVRALAPRVPAGPVVVAESGVHGHADARGLAPLADALLVGSALCAAPDVPAAVRELVFGRVKVCGLTRPADAAAAWAAGATHGGLVFAPGSKRQVDGATAARVRAAAPLRWVGVFVDAPAATIAAHAHALGLAAVQLHGDEPPAAVAALKPLLPPGCEVWKAVRVRDRAPRRAETGADRLLLDTWQPGAPGGTGRAFDWEVVRAHPERGDLVVAGGLGRDNAAAADALGVWALDASSGLEEAPGVKSAARMEAFFAALRGPGRAPRAQESA
ncbi:MAG TPA: bifunctional indole-3-glycerol-phosphate synthase TrpC/phosphoribosylanthranilate isomerase TrpF [Polyangia bacterium]|jgi:indole-3-glycerol phosphate synthase/phosphoribosylanthranilate isomerase